MIFLHPLYKKIVPQKFQKPMPIILSQHTFLKLFQNRGIKVKICKKWEEMEHDITNITITSPIPKILIKGRNILNLNLSF